MVKRLVTKVKITKAKKEYKIPKRVYAKKAMKQKETQPPQGKPQQGHTQQGQAQQVTVNIGAQARARRPTKPPQAPQNPIVTRGPTTFYQQPQPAPQPIQSEGRSINELYKLIKQQAQANQPAPQPLASLVETASIVPPAKVEEILKVENELERVRKARVAKFEKPELEKVFEEQQAGDNLEDKAYQEFNQFKSMTQLFRAAEKEEPEVSLLSEGRSDPSFNLFPSGRIVPEYVSPDLSLHASSLLDPPRPNLTRADTDTNDDSTPRQQQAFSDLFSLAKASLVSLEPKQTSGLLVSAEGDKSKERSVEIGTNVQPEFIKETEQALPASASLEEEESAPEITELNLEEASQLPAIVKPLVEDTPLVQLLTPTAEPSLVEAIAPEAIAPKVRAPDQYRTETLVKGSASLEEDIGPEPKPLAKATPIIIQASASLAEESPFEEVILTKAAQIKEKWDELKSLGLLGKDIKSTKPNPVEGGKVLKKSTPEWLKDIHSVNGYEKWHAKKKTKSTEAIEVEEYDV